MARLALGAAGREQGGIDEDERAPGDAIDDVRVDVGDRGERMEDAGGRLGAEPRVDAGADDARVARDLPVGVAGFVMARVLAVVALVEHDDLEIVEQQAPEREVAVDREAVAVAEHDARRRRRCRAGGCG